MDKVTFNDLLNKLTSTWKSLNSTELEFKITEEIMTGLPGEEPLAHLVLNIYEDEKSIGFVTRVVLEGNTRQEAEEWLYDFTISMLLLSGLKANKIEGQL